MVELSLHVLDIAQNSVAAGAGLVEIDIALDSIGDNLLISVKDDGRGMDKESAARAEDPFFTTRTTRKVGLGIPLFKMSALMTGGSFSLKSAPDEGTYIKAVYKNSHIDRLPLGDMAETVAALIMGSPGTDLVCRLKKDGASYTLDTREMRGVLGDIPLSAPEVQSYIKNEIKKAVSDILQI